MKEGGKYWGEQEGRGKDPLKEPGNMDTRINSGWQT